MTQQNIRESYEQTWKQQSDAASSVEQVGYSSPVEDAVLYPIYRQLIADLKLVPTDARVLDVGSGSGRWLRFFLEHTHPRRLLGIDYTQASIDLLAKWLPSTPAGDANVDVRLASITDANLALGEQFDLINIANVLFHIPENDLFLNALKNLARHLDAGGRVVTTEYLPRHSMRTEWMMVRSRYEFEQACKLAGLRIIDIRATSVFGNDPMGLDGTDAGTRAHFHRVRQMSDALRKAMKDATSAKFAVDFLAEIERAVLAFGKERVADLDMPSQKLVTLARL
jgi:SAM-dependent methyltransferase